VTEGKRGTGMAVAVLVAAAVIFALVWFPVGRGDGDGNHADLPGTSGEATAFPSQPMVLVAEAVVKRAAPVIEGSSDSGAGGGGSASDTTAEGSAGGAGDPASAEDVPSGDAQPATSLPPVAEPPEDTVLMLEPELVARGVTYEVSFTVYGTGPEPSSVVVHVSNSTPSEALNGAFDPNGRNLVALVDAATLGSLATGVEYRATLAVYLAGRFYGLRLNDVRAEM